MSFDVPLERGKIREFARAAQSKDPAYDGADALIPPTFLTTARNFWTGSEDSAATIQLGFQLARVLHGEEEYEFFGPLPHAGQTLHAETRLGEQWQKEGGRGGLMRFARIVTEYRDDNGALVAEQRTTVIETGHAPKAP